MYKKSKSIRFGFGNNWKAFSKDINKKQLLKAKEGLIKLFPDNYNSKNKSFLDIGCGSGLHSIAAKLIGFQRVLATDYDEISIEATVKNQGLFNSKIEVMQDDILNTNLKSKFDVVYSWGVLHHTGNMEQAIEQSKYFVNSNGCFIIAIYKKTLFCSIWYYIKKLYCKSPSIIKMILNYLFFSLRVFLYKLKGKSLKNYKEERGMDLFYDAIDWLGGFPYESAKKDKIVSIVGEGFELIKFFDAKPNLGLMGSACSEYTFIKK